MEKIVDVIRKLFIEKIYMVKMPWSKNMLKIKNIHKIRHFNVTTFVAESERLFFQSRLKQILKSTKMSLKSKDSYGGRQRRFSIDCKIEK